MESPATATTMRRPCFIGEDDGLASIAEFSGNNNNIYNNNNNNSNNNNYNNFVNYQNQPYMMRRKNSLRNISSLSTNTVPSAATTTTTTTAVFSPRSGGRMFDPRFEEVHSPHFLESCSLCHKPLGGNRDIFMYRGDTPFCTEECRQEQIEIDEAKEKNWNLKALRAKKEGKKSSSSSSPSKAQNYSFRTGTVAAA